MTNEGSKSSGNCNKLEMAASELCKFGLKYFQASSLRLLAPCLNTAVNLQFVRYRRAKHWNPKFKKLRTLKVMKVDLPNFDEKPEDLSEEEVRSKMKERGLLPPRPWMERPFYISCTGGVFEAYIPPEGDGKVSAITMPGAKQKLELLEKKGKSMMAIRKIRSFDEDFNPHEFAVAAQDIYIAAHNFLMSKDKMKLREVVTERAYPEMKYNTRDKTIHWKFIKSLEPPRVVHARCTDIISKDNIFAQLTVRFHTQQVLAIYDRFGRLMHGSEILAKDVLEYVVFEKHLSNQYGQWRLHDKIIPDWMPAKEPGLKTYRLPEEVPTEQETKPVEVPEPKADEPLTNTAAVA
ncbi:large ribosomal subunit protein mL45 [Anabrus simplex]|uniref:large ribosomal subunit protein mL45 n=1 Tax=Anabrus simplex TaxID=316456 RepID=UPI0034DD09AA